MINAGTVTAFLTLDTNRFNAGMESASAQLQALKDGSLTAGEKLQGVGGALTTIGGTLTRNVTLPLVGAGAAALTVAANFDEGMSKVAAISGATGEDLDKLRDKAREMGAKTKFSATEAADAMSYMAMAGWKTGEMLDGIEGIMNLAAASGEDLATTSDIVTDALTAFGLKAKDSAHFSDILAAASSNANTNVSMMGESFKYCAPIAGAMGYSAEDVAEALGLMANSGIKASQAGTALRSIMAKLNGDIKISGKELGDVTIKTTNADGSMRELSDILADLRGAFSKLTESEKSANAETLGGRYAMSGLLALVNAAPEDIGKLSGAISNCDGAAEKMAATMQNNLKGQLTILKSQTEELAIGFGSQLMPVAQDLVGVASGAVQAFSGLSDGTKKFIVYAGLAAAAMGPLTSVIGSVTSGVGSMITAIGGAATAFTAAGGGAAGLGAAITSLIGPAGWVVLAIGAVTAAGVALYAATRDADKGTRELGDAFKGAADGAKSFYEEVQNGGSVNLTTSFTSELNSGTDMNDLQQKISKTQQKITDIIKKAQKERRSLTKTDINNLKKYYDELRKLHEEQANYYTNNLTALSQAINDGLELNEESAKEILQQGKANMDAALEAEKKAHFERIGVIEKTYKDDAEARKKAMAEENAYYEQRTENIRNANAELVSAVTNGYAEQNLAGSEFFEKLKQYNADVEAENQRHEKRLAKIQEDARAGKQSAANEMQAEMNLHNQNMNKLNQQLADNFKGTNAEVIKSQLGMLATLKANGGEINETNAEFVREFAAAYSNLPEDVRKDMDATVAEMKLTGRTGEIIDSVGALCGDIQAGFDSGLRPVATTAESGINLVVLKTVAELEASGQQVPDEMKKIADETLAQWDSLPEETKKQMKEVMAGALEELEAGNPELYKAAEENGDSYINAFKEKMGIASPSKVMQEMGDNTIEGFILGMNAKKDTAVSTITGIMQGMLAAAGSVSFTGIGGNVVSGILWGINDRAPSLISRAKSLASGVAETVRQTLNVNSPSKVMIPMGQAVAEGMEVGLLNGAGSLYETASAISLETAEALGSISTRGVNLSGVHSTNYGDRLDRLLDAVEKLADSQTTMEIDGRPFGRLVREYV